MHWNTENRRIGITNGNDQEEKGKITNNYKVQCDAQAPKLVPKIIAQKQTNDKWQ